MRKRRWRRRVLVAFLGLLVALGVYAWQRVGQTLQAWGIERLAFDGIALGLTDARLAELTLVWRDPASGARAEVRAREVALGWQDLLSAQRVLHQLTLAELNVRWQGAPQNLDAPASAPGWPGLEALYRPIPGGMPRLLRVDRLHLRLPCPAGECSLEGALALQHSGSPQFPARLDLYLNPADHRVHLQAEWSGATAQPALQVIGHLDDQPRLSLTTRLAFAEGAPAPHWLGQLSVRTLPEAPWLLAWLAQWQGLDGQALALPADLPVDALQIQADWQVQVPAAHPDAWAAWSQTPGQLTVDAQLPVAWPIAGLGGVQGELALTLRSEGQGWQVQAGQVRAQSARLQWGEVRLQDVLARFSVEGRLTATQIDLRVQPGAELSARQLTHPLLQMDRVRIQPGALVLSGTPQDLRMQAPLDVQVGQLRAPHVHAQGWRWQGPVTLQWTQNPSARNLSTQNLSWHAKGVVRADSGLSLSLDARHTPDGAEIALTLQELFLRAGNPLARTLVAWPALLELNNGRLNARATLKLGGIAPVMDAQLDIKGAAGIYDRAAFEGLTAQAQVQWDARTLRLNLPALDLVRLDVGVPIGPMRLQADYQATPQTLASGTLSWTQASAGLLGGQVMLAPGQRRLDAQDEPLTLQLTGLELEQLFRLYPAEDLAGQGTVDGSLPLRIGPQGVSVAAGELQAREPGGRLLLRSPRIQALGRSNPGMQLVVQSLEDFHYAVLRSGVSYDENGKLLLTLRLEGRNPSVEGGRPIHFNITLEEDLPALLASLQLTDTVSETIKKRVQERMRQRPPSPP